AAVEAAGGDVQAAERHVATVHGARVAVVAIDGRALARSRLAAVARRAGVAVVAARALLLRHGVRAGAVRRIAGALDLARAGDRARHGCAGGADARLAAVALRAGVAVVASGAVGLRQTGRAEARAGVARRLDVALIGGRADRRRSRDARARMA